MATPGSNVDSIPNQELYALAGMSSASSAMFERRRRILREAQMMLARDGLSGFSTMELSRLSGVAQRTIFNAFGSRDNLIALAIRFYFEQFNQRLSQSFDEGSLRGSLEKLAATTLRNLQLRNYMTAIVALHFSPTAPAEVRAVTLAIGAGFFRTWLAQVPTLRLTDLERLMRQIAHLEYAVLNDWLLGILDDGQVVDQTLQAVLEMMCGALSGEPRRQVEDCLAEIRAGGAWAQTIKAKAASALRVPIDVV